MHTFQLSIACVYAKAMVFQNTDCGNQCKWTFQFSITLSKSTLSSISCADNMQHRYPMAPS